MLSPLIERPGRRRLHRERERGVTMAFVALSMLALISMAALSIDIGALYEAKTEAQRSADLAALAAARMISLEGATGDPTGPATISWADVCGGATSPASLAAIAIAQQNLINGAAPSTINVYYGTRNGVTAGTSDCTGAGPEFTVNPVIQVNVQQATLPTYFARVFSLITSGAGGNSGVSATGTAEVYNSSGSGALPAGMVPVQPRCVKPWLVPNADPGNGGLTFVNLSNGTITNAGTQISAPKGVIGESFALHADCGGTATPACAPPSMPKGTGGSGILQYVPATTTGTVVAVASNSSCSLSNNFQSEIAGCDQTTVYACGTPTAVTPNLTENPEYLTPASGDTATGIQCLTNSLSGSDQLAGGSATPDYPFQIMAGFGNPLVQAGVVNNDDIVTTSNSIVTLPIFDSSGPPTAPLPPVVTVVGYLQVFIDGVSGGPTGGYPTVTVLNVSGCTNAAGGNPTVAGSSPVPIRLITSP